MVLEGRDIGVPYEYYEGRGQAPSAAQCAPKFAYLAAGVAVLPRVRRAGQWGRIGKPPSVAPCRQMARKWARLYLFAPKARGCIVANSGIQLALRRFFPLRCGGKE